MFALNGIARRCSAFILLLASVCTPVQGQQNHPLVRQFRAGEIEVFSVELTARSEVEGQRAEKIGVRAYATPFNFSSEEKLSWRVTRKILSTAPDGSAEIEEMLDRFSPLAETPDDAQADEKGKTDAALRLALLEWSRPGKITLHYHESSRGEIRGLSSDAGPVFDNEPAVLTLWLRRALRPSAALRGAPGSAESHWREPRTVALPPWKNARGTELGEWLPGPVPQLSSVRFDNLHVTQQITAEIPAVEGVASEGEARFHAESISTIVGAGAVLDGNYGSLAQATRSGSREILRTLMPVAGLNEPPRFRSLLSVDVRLTRSDFPPR